MMVAIPELDGSTGPMIFGGRSHAEAWLPRAAFETVRASRASRRCWPRALRNLSRCAAASARDRKVALVLFNFPPNSGNAGTAAYLSVFESLHRTLAALRDAGYSVDVPADVAALRERLLGGNAKRFGADANVAVRIPANDHVRRETWLKEIESQWGPAPGRQQSDGSTIHVLGERFGNVFVGIQPSFGYEGDPMRLLFEKGFAPTHAFSAFYRWLREDFGAAAVLHFGTHGALEFMPGKQTGMSRRLLAGPDDRRSAEHLSLCLQQSVRRHDRQAPLRRDLDQLSDAAGRACRALSRPGRSEGFDRTLARPGA